MGDWDAWIGRIETRMDRIDPGMAARWLAITVSAAMPSARARDVVIKSAVAERTKVDFSFIFDLSVGLGCFNETKVGLVLRITRGLNRPFIPRSFSVHKKARLAPKACFVQQKSRGFSFGVKETAPKALGRR